MPALQSDSSIVRPRVTSGRAADACPLREVIAEILDDLPTGLVWIVGLPGSGKSTAINYLLEAFSGDKRLLCCDELTPDVLGSMSETCLVVGATSAPRVQSGIVLRLQPWGVDDLVEYLLANHRTMCGSVIERLGPAARGSWLPQLACIVLDQFARDATLSDIEDAYVRQIREMTDQPADFSSAAEFCLRLFTGSQHRAIKAGKKLQKVSRPHRLIDLLRHRELQLPLAADRLVYLLRSRKGRREMMPPLPLELIERVGTGCADNPAVVEHLKELLASPKNGLLAANAAGILFAAQPDWRPQPRLLPWRLSGGFFPAARWADIDLSRATLANCDFTGADLRGAKLVEATITGARLGGADLERAHLASARAMAACFHDANLRHALLTAAHLSQAEFNDADLTSADCSRADLTGAFLVGTRCQAADFTAARLVGIRWDNADLTDAILNRAHLPHADLRTVELQGASFERANLAHAQLEDIFLRGGRFQSAKLEYAHFTGSSLPGADFRDADLSNSHLAEIHWEEADLRGADLRMASFHMGSSRSGLVDSPIAREGSMTGFYTDDREEMYFKQPEEIRKANLRGADLRGAKVAGVDFYLVDLREARLDTDQYEQAIRNGAILDDVLP